MVTFLDTPSTTRVPFFYVEFDASAARPTTGALQVFKLLVIGQSTGGTVAALEPTIVRNGEDGHGLFGAGSVLAHMLETVFLNQNVIEVTAVALDDDGGATAATGTLTITGTSTDAGTAFVYVAGRRYAVGVSSGDDPTSIATAIVAAVTADTLAHVDVANVLGVVTFTAKNGGTLGNSIDLRANYFLGEENPAGVTYAFVAMSSGATDPDIAPVWAVLADTQYNVISCANTDTANLNELKAELDRRYLPTRAIDAVGIVAVQDTQANLITLGNPRNDRFLSIMGYDNGPTPPWQWSAAISAQVVKSAQKDPAQPFQSLVLLGILPPLTIDAFTLTEQEQLLADGIAIFNLSGFGDAVIARLATTYKLTLTTAVPDDTFSDLNTPLTLGFYRDSLASGLAKQFARHKLAGDNIDVPAGQLIVTPRIMKAAIVGIARGWVERGLMENLELFKDAIFVERDIAADPNRLDVVIEPDLVNQLRVVRVLTRFKI